MLANNKITSKGIEFINVLENVTNKEIDVYYDLIKEKSVILKEEPKYDDKLTSLCNNFMNELEENNCGVFFNFLELLRKV
ncbi:hypothetical protein H311_05174 [Anncaliia algerae PRA109]|nr:hypothetical protein H311_05174 [Anncaliia algerae PRA109]